MNQKYRIIATLSITLALTLGSCNVFKKNNKITADKDSGVTIEKVKESTPAITETDTAKVVVNERKSTTTADVEKQISGEWTIISVYNKKITIAEMPFLNFDTATNKLYGNNGCNVINGEFSISGKKKELTFTNMITSMMMCPDYKSETLIMRAISEVVNFSFITIKGIIHLNLLDKRGSTVLQLKRHNLHELNGAWTIKEINQKEVEDENVKLVIDIPELKLHGNSGCNIINGGIALDPNKDFAIQFLQIVSTRKMCPNISTEMDMLVALEEVETYKKINPNEVVFFNNKKERVLKFKKLNLNR